MKKLACLVGLFVCAQALAQAEFATSGSTGGNGTGVSVLDCQGAAPPAVVGAGVACACNGCVPRYTRDNGWARRWAGPQSVSQVQWSAETCDDSDGGGQDCLVEVRLYDLAGGTFPTRPGTPDRAIIDDIKSTQSGQVYPQHRTVNVSPAFAVAAGRDLVVEIYQLDGQPDLNAMWIGVKTAGGTAPSYIHSIGCGTANWADVAGLGFPNAHWIICQDSSGGGGCTGNEKVNSAKCKAVGKPLVVKTTGGNPGEAVTASAGGKTGSKNAKANGSAKIKLKGVTGSGTANVTWACGAAGSATYSGC